MVFEVDQELVEDFLIESGEIIEALSEQLVELENDPDNLDLLHAIYRGFHTIKGGSGFLNLTTLVEINHITENVFDLLRNKQRKVTPELMDVILQSLDSISDMFATIKEGKEPEAADKELLERLALLSIAENSELKAEPESETEPEPEIFEIVKEDKVEDTGTDVISEDEFEALLDQLHGFGVAPSGSDTKAKLKESEIMDEDDFDLLLDQIYGK